MNYLFIAFCISPQECLNKYFFPKNLRFSRLTTNMVTFDYKHDDSFLIQRWSFLVVITFYWKGYLTEYLGLDPSSLRQDGHVPPEQWLLRDKSRTYTLNASKDTSKNSLPLISHFQLFFWYFDFHICFLCPYRVSAFTLKRLLIIYR